MPILRKLAAGVDRLNDMLGASIRWLVLAMVFVGAGTAILRYAGRTFDWSMNLTPGTELQWYMFSLVFLMGAAYGVRHDAHVRVDVLYSTLSRTKRAWIDLVGTVLFLIPFSVVMLIVSWPAVMNSVSVRERSPDPGGLARWPIKIVILISFALLIVQALSQITKYIDVIRGARVPEPQEPEVHL